MIAPPIMFTWTGEAMEPVARFRRACDHHYVVGEKYVMIPQEERSMRAHRGYFARLNEMWGSLPERYNNAPFAKTAEHLRHYALIRTGHYNFHTVICPTSSEASRVANFARPIDEYSIVMVEDATVTRFEAKSQSVKAMGKEEFYKSIDDVERYVEGLLEVERPDR